MLSTSHSTCSCSPRPGLDLRTRSFYLVSPHLCSGWWHPIPVQGTRKEYWESAETFITPCGLWHWLLWLIIENHCCKWYIITQRAMWSSSLWCGLWYRASRQIFEISSLVLSFPFNCCGHLLLLSVVFLCLFWFQYQVLYDTFKAILPSLRRWYKKTRCKTFWEHLKQFGHVQTVFPCSCQRGRFYFSLRV